MSHAHRYEAQVAADCEAEAIEVVAEGLPPRAEIIEAIAQPKPGGLWFVTLRYRSPREAESKNVPD